MLPASLENRAIAYVSGALAPPERASFEVLLEFDPMLRAEISRLLEASAALCVATALVRPEPSRGLKTRLLAGIGPQAARSEPDAMVVTGADRRIVWVNQAFTDMCGYVLDELRGRSPGGLLQGPGTDAAVVARMRLALAANRFCRESLVNYHKDGSAYSVDVRIDPIPDDEGAPLYFVARERKIADLSPAA